MNSTPASFRRFPVPLKVIARETDHVSSRVGIATVNLTVRAQPEPTEDHEAGCLRGHLESQNVPIKRQQVVQVFAPDRCSAQPCDHRGGPFLAPSAPFGGMVPFSMRGMSRWVRGEDYPMSVALVHSGPSRSPFILLAIGGASRLAQRSRSLARHMRRASTSTSRRQDALWETRAALENPGPSPFRTRS